MIIAFLVIVQVVWGIGIVLKRGDTRCMIVHSTKQQENIKLDLNFVPIPNKQPYDTYHLTVFNSQNMNVVFRDNVIQGRYRRQISLEQNIPHCICMNAIVHHDFGKVVIDFQAATQFQTETNIKIPQNMLNIEHMNKTFSNTIKLLKLAERHIQFQKERSAINEQLFYKANNISNEIILYCTIQICIIVASITQIFFFRKFLQNNHYL